MNILILGGFLGSGKTTCLMQLAKYLVDTAPPEKEKQVYLQGNAQEKTDELFRILSGKKII